MNGDIEIRVEQVGSGPFPSSVAISKSNLGHNEQRLP